MTRDSDAATLPDGSRIGRTALCVSDREDVVEFYRRVVGLSVLRADETGSELGVDGTALLVVEESETATERGRDAAGLYHNAFRVPSRSALGDALRRVREHWNLDGASDHHVSEALYLTDPEGNGVEIYRDRPESTWLTNDDGTVRMGADRLDLGALEATGNGSDRAPSGTDVGHVHLEVTSLEASERFYVDALGFETRATAPGARFVSAGGYHHHLGVNTWHRRTTPARGRGISWFEVVVPDDAALDAVRARAADRDVSIGKTNTGIELSDPDEIAVRVRAER